MGGSFVKKNIFKFCISASFVFFFSLELKAQNQLYEGNESSIYVKPFLGMIVLGKTNVELRPIVDDSDTFTYTQDGYGYFPSIIGIGLEREMAQDLFLELEAGFFRNYDEDELTSDRESHILIAIGPVFRHSSNSPVTPFVSLSFGSMFSQYNSTGIIQDEFASVIDDAISFLGQAGVGADFGFSDDIEFGVGYKFMFIGGQNELEVFGIEPQKLYFGSKIGHRIEGIFRIGSNFF